MSQFRFTPETLYEKTNNGLDVIKHFLSGCYHFDKALQSSKNPFKYRDSEDTASAYLFQGENDVWFVKDFGGKSYSPVSVCMDKMGLAYGAALKYLYEVFAIDNNKTFFTADVEVKTCDESDERPVGWFHIEKSDTYLHLDIVGKHLTPEQAAEYDFYSVKSYERIFIKKDTGAKTWIKIAAKDSYPIFCYQPEETWSKIYAPFDKKHKHSYLGTKPDHYVFGLKQIKAKFDAEIKELNEKLSKAVTNGENIEAGRLETIISNFKLEPAIGCSGGSDGLNIPSLEYFPVWLNSESEQLSYDDITQILMYCKDFYNLPDIDGPGTKYGIEFAEKFWYIKTIWLNPAKMVANGKDLRDWVKFYNNLDLKQLKYKFSNLLKGALQMQFYDRFTIKGTVKYKLRMEYLLYFLNCKGFFTYKIEQKNLDQTANELIVFVQVVGNVVYKVSPRIIREFAKQCAKDKGEAIELADVISTSTLFSENNLLNLKSRTFDFKNYTPNSQFFFFHNQIVEITAEKINLVKHGSFKNYVWAEALNSHTILPEAPFFEYFKDELGNDNIKVLRQDCEYFNYLTNASRIFWQKEKNIEADVNKFNIAGEGLDDEEILIHKKHLLNKLFAIGYLAHRYKQKSFARMLYVMDDKPKESDDDSNGRTGKSVMFDGVDYLLPNRFFLDGKSTSITTDRHILQGLTKHSDYLLIDDIDRFFNVNWLYTKITSSITVNPKQNQPYEIPFHEAPKLAVTSNYGLASLSGSTLGRILFVSFSDWYHAKTELHSVERRISDDFEGKDMFDDWTAQQWNRHYQLLMQCVQLYLQHRGQEFQAPTLNITMNNINAKLGDAFLDWINSYWSEDKFSTEIFRRDMFNNYRDMVGKTSKSATKWKKDIELYCKSKNWTLSVDKKRANDGTSNVIECFIISNFEHNAPANEPANENPDDQHFIDFDDTDVTY